MGSRCLELFGEQESTTMIGRDTTIEDLVRTLPKSVHYMRKKGIRCLACGEPLWGTIESAAKEKGFSEDEIDQIVEDLRALDKKNGEQ